MVTLRAIIYEINPEDDDQIRRVATASGPKGTVPIPWRLAFSGQVPEYTCDEFIKLSRTDATAEALVSEVRKLLDAQEWRPRKRTTRRMAVRKGFRALPRVPLARKIVNLFRRWI